MAIVDHSPAATPVRLQYETFPYPLRDPADEETRLLGTVLDHLMTVQHYCYRGKKDFSNNFRVLVAGGGTGDGLVYLTHQLQNTNAEIVYLDLSSASMDITRERVRRNKFKNKITWIKDSLLNLPKLGLEPFDYINCSGVLHHLPDPDEGLAALRSVLKDDGAMALMVYGKYGRTGVYQMQELMRLINQDEPDMHTKVENTQTILGRLPDSNWLKRQAHYVKTEMSHSIGVYDLFLHSQDRAYTVPQLYEFVEKAGLNLIEFIPDMRILYNPLLVLRGAPFYEKVVNLPKRQQQAIAEIYYGNITKHEFWVSPQTDTVADFLHPDNIPQFNDVGAKKMFNPPPGATQEATSLKQAILGTKEDEWKFLLEYPDGIHVTRRLRLDKTVRKLIELIDGRRTMGEIVQLLITECATPPKTEDVRNFCKNALSSLREYDLILLRHRSAPEIVDQIVTPLKWKKKRPQRKTQSQRA